MTGSTDSAAATESGVPFEHSSSGTSGAVPCDDEILRRLRPLISEVTGVPGDDIAMGHVLATDLGAESIDLLDLSFLIEEEFGITIEPDEFESRARQRLPGVDYEKDGYLTDEALAELRDALPEIDPARLSVGLRKTDLPNLLTVAVFVHLIQRKLIVQGEEERHA